MAAALEPRPSPPHCRGSASPQAPPILPRAPLPGLGSTGNAPLSTLHLMTKVTSKEEKSSKNKPRLPWGLRRYRVRLAMQGMRARSPIWGSPTRTEQLARCAATAAAPAVRSPCAAAAEQTPSLPGVRTTPDLPTAHGTCGPGNARPSPGQRPGAGGVSRQAPASGPHTPYSHLRPQEPQPCCFPEVPWMTPAGHNRPQECPG